MNVHLLKNKISLVSITMTGAVLVLLTLATSCVTREATNREQMARKVMEAVARADSSSIARFFMPEECLLALLSLHAEALDETDLLEIRAAAATYRSAWVSSLLTRCKEIEMSSIMYEDIGLAEFPDSLVHEINQHFGTSSWGDVRVQCQDQELVLRLFRHRGSWYLTPVLPGEFADSVRARTAPQ